MTRPIAHHPDPELDLVFERSVDVPRELVWQAWTDPEHVKQWFTPAPWSTVECEIDLRPGGIFRTVMRSPEGDEHTNLGCFLEVIEGERLTWTEALEPGFRPSRTGSHIETCGTSTLTAVIQLTSEGNGTKYTALVMHRSKEDREGHEAAGFHDGWGAAFEQLVEVVRRLQTAGA
ncbi:MAG: SRPBCC family protein [Candidatus Eisenbacteria bacterium]|uniref:SRPBCC family protein n=1 Tax=Eiseniibacteriota bacterium TaxID=2212470 RepID=A0A956LXG8_UNCEI|nr:SRPBCC family protein [Candidatus Eisenbacteria bacterium]